MQTATAVKEKGQSNEDALVVFTNEVSEDDIESLDNLRYCPMQFQEKIEKKLELRTTVVGDHAFTIAIDSQQNKKTELDWRRLAQQTTRNWFAYDLPEDIIKKLVEYNRYFHLNYSAVDILLTPDDEYIFLEANPAGEFDWADTRLDGVISEHIAKVLMGEATRLGHTPYKMPKAALV